MVKERSSVTDKTDEVERAGQEQQPEHDTQPSRHQRRTYDHRLRELGILPADDAPPFDLIGDVHGCIRELRQLLEQLGYEPEGEGYSHRDGRRLVFVGDLVDRGPGVAEVLQIALAMHAAGTALLVVGNHDEKFLRWLRGRHVHITFGLHETIMSLQALPAQEGETVRARATALFANAPSYLLLDGGRLVVTHGAILDPMIGTWNEDVARYCMYGDVIGHTAHGKPMRRDWGAARDIRSAGGEQAPRIVYGHNVVPTLRWVNRTVDIDTGCVYGGHLSALRYPECEFVQVPAERAYAHRR